MTVPYSFASRTTAIPLSELDSNFNTTITLGNTAIQLGNTVTTLNNMTLANVTITSGTINSAVTHGDVVATGGLYAKGNLAATFSDGVVLDYVTGTARISSGSSDNVAFYNGGVANTELMRLDSSGNLGLGVTPSAWATFKAFELKAVGNGISAATNQLDLNNGAYYNAGWKYADTYAISQIELNGGAIYFKNAAAGTPGNAVSFNTAMTLDASGNLGIGCSPSQRLHLSNAGNVFAQIQNTSNGVNAYVGLSGTNFTVGTSTTHPVTFITSDTERMRIDSSGNLLVGKTVTTFSTNGVTLSNGGNNFSATSTAVIAINRNGTDGSVIDFYKAGTGVGSISVTGSATAYNTSSDYRLKENVQPMTNALGLVAQLNPVTYTWKADGSDGQGFIAHELQAVVPDCVTGEKDAVDEEGKPVYQGIDTSFLVATLTKAIQELSAQTTALKAELDATKAEVAALKGN